MYVKNLLISHILYDNIVLVMMKGRVLNTLRAIHYWVNALGILVDIWNLRFQMLSPRKKLVFAEAGFFISNFSCIHYNAAELENQALLTNPLNIF